MFFNLAAAALTATLAAAQPQLGASSEIETPSYGFIVELEPGSTFRSESARKVVPDYQVRLEFTNPEVFFGVSIDAPNTTDVAGLLALPEVKRVWPNRYHERPEPFISTSLASFSSSNSSTKTRRDAVPVIHVNGTSDVNAPLKMTNVDKVHALGFKGKGVKIGILDTGIDYRHPALGGGFGAGFKVAGGYDLVGDAYTGANKPQPDDDPLASCLSGGHGTHVAGIIGAQDPEGVGFGLVGVAPEASLYAYRILGCTGGVLDDVVLAGFQKAAEDGVDLISMSVGATRPWEADSALQSAFAALKKKGIGMVVAAGNAGRGGPYYASWPALDPSIIGVGSVQNTNFPVAYTALDAAKADIEYISIAPMDNTKEWLVFDPSDKGSFGCVQQSWYDAAAKWDPSRIIAFMDASSSCQYSVPYFMDQTGIRNVWFALPDETDLELPAPLGDGSPHVVYLRKTHGDKITKGIESMGWNYTMTFPDRSVHNVSQPSGGAMSIFSSFGPTLDLVSLKPQISAPGGTVLNTWPASDGVGYAVLSGTSMATPHVAGAYALLKQAVPGITPDEILARLQSTAKPLSILSQPDMLVTTAQQGGGMIDVLSALNTETLITPTQFNLRDSASPAPQTIIIENKFNEPKAYQISHRGGSFVNASPNLHTAPPSNYDMFNWVENNAATYASVSFSTSSVTVPAGSSTSITVTVSPPQGDPDLHPLYSGFVAISSGGTDTYSLPYIGVPHAYNSTATMDLTDLFTVVTKPLPPPGIPLSPYLRSTSYNRRNNDLMTFTFPAWAPPPDSDEDQDDDDDVLVGFTLSQPSAYVRIDAVTPFYSRRGAHRPTSLGFDPCAARKLNISEPPAEVVETFDGIPSYGLMYSLSSGHSNFPPARFQAYMGLGYGIWSVLWRWAEVEAPNGTMIQLPNGDYRLLVRVLKAGLTDWETPGSWESWLSPVVRVNISDPGYPNPFDKYNES